MTRPNRTTQAGTEKPSGCKHDGALDVHPDGKHTCEDCGDRVLFTEEFGSAAEAIAGRHEKPTGLPQDWKVTEGISGIWHYHLRRGNSGPAACGAQVMTCQVPRSAWGHVGHLRERWCSRCAAIAEGSTLPQDAPTPLPYRELEGDTPEQTKRSAAANKTRIPRLPGKWCPVGQRPHEINRRNGRCKFCACRPRF